MPDVPQQPQDILRAARERASIVARHLEVLGADLAEPRPGVLGEPDRVAGVAALARAAAALQDVVDAIRAGEATGAGGPGAAGSKGEGGEDVEHA